MTTEQVVRDQAHGWCAEAECLELATWKCGRGQHWVCNEHKAPLDNADFFDDRCARCKQDDQV